MKIHSFRIFDRNGMLYKQAFNKVSSITSATSTRSIGKHNIILIEGSKRLCKNADSYDEFTEALCVKDIKSAVYHVVDKDISSIVITTSLPEENEYSVIELHNDGFVFGSNDVQEKEIRNNDQMKSVYQSINRLIMGDNVYKGKYFDMYCDEHDLIKKHIPRVGSFH